MAAAQKVKLLMGGTALSTWVLVGRAERIPAQAEGRSNDVVARKQAPCETGLGLVVSRRSALKACRRPEPERAVR